MNTTKYEPLKGSSCISLTKQVANKKALYNVNNDDDKSLVWALKSALYSAKTYVSNKYSYKRNGNPNLEGIVDFPTPVSQIPKVEECFDLAINVYGYAVLKKVEKITIFPKRTVKN